jgi:hypothetical protein
MPEQRMYATAAALRQALEARLKTVSLEDAVDLQRLRRQVGFDRFLARLCAVPSRDWVLKGGYAMELRFVAARSTKDLDFTLRSGDGNSALDQLQVAGALDIGDFFSFRVGDAMLDLVAAPYGGARYPVDALMDGRVFVKFHVDVGIGDVILDPMETVTTRDWLAFAEIPPPSVAIIAREQQFAEKVHAYTLPRSNRNSRVRDLVDMVLLVQSQSLQMDRTRDALHRTFERRATHELPKALTRPPTEWERPFLALAEECRIELGLRAAYDIVLRFWTLLAQD